MLNPADVQALAKDQKLIAARTCLARVTGLTISQVANYGMKSERISALTAAFNVIAEYIAELEKE